MTFHPNLVIGKLWKVYPDIAARDADSASHTSYHVNHIVRVNNPKSFYSLASVGPTVWKEELAGSGSGAPFDPSGLITSITANANQVATHEADAAIHVNAADKAALHDGVAQDTALATHVGDVAAHAGASYDDTAITARVTTLEGLDHSQLHDGGPQDTAIAANTAHVADVTPHVTAPEKALLHDGTVQDIAIAANTAHVADATPHMSVPEKAQLHDILTLTTTGGAGPTLTGQVLNLPPAVVSPENIIVGSAAPTAGDGQDGDFWVDASAARWPVYGPKAAGVWPAHDGGSYMFDHGIGTLANFTTIDTDHAVAKEWAPDTLISAIKPDIIVNTQVEADITNVLDGQRIQIGRATNYLATYENISGATQLATGANRTDGFIFAPIHRWRGGMLRTNGAIPFHDDSNIYFSDWAVGVQTPPLRERSHYFVGIVQATEATWDGSQKIEWTFYQSVEYPPASSTYVWAEQVPSAGVQIVYPGNNGAVQLNKENVYYLDETIGTIPPATDGQEYAVSIVQANLTDAQGVKDAAKAKVSHFRAFDTGAGFIWIETAALESTTHLNFRYIAESVDSGAATEQGSTWIDGVTWPPGEPNDLLLWNDDIGAFKKGDVYRCIRSTVGIVSDWETWRSSSELVTLPSGYEIVKYTGTLPASTNTNISITLPAGKIIVDYQLLVNFSGSTLWLNPSYYAASTFYAQILADETAPAIGLNSIGTSLQGKPYRLLVTFAN